ncbi:MAG: hypothetical protein ACI8SE_001274, partial [Bacteroidia bacterium]
EYEFTNSVEFAGTAGLYSLSATLNGQLVSQKLMIK